LKIDGGITDEMFICKEKEYQAELITLKGQLNSVEKVNPNFYEDGCKILELSNSLHRLYLKANNQEKAHILKLIASNYIFNDVSICPSYRKPFSFFNEKGFCSRKLPTCNTQQTFSNVISEEIPYYYVWRNKMQSLTFGQKPSSLPKNKVVNQREMKHYQFTENYVNPIQKALNFQELMSAEDLNQSQLATKLGISRVRVNQILKLLNLPEEKQKYILKYGKKEMITERSLR
jgi:hypothetical protein